MTVPSNRDEQLGCVVDRAVDVVRSPIPASAANARGRRDPGALVGVTRSSRSSAELREVVRSLSHFSRDHNLIGSRECLRLVALH